MSDPDEIGDAKAYILAWEPPPIYWMRLLALYRGHGSQPWRDHANQRTDSWWEGLFKNIKSSTVRLSVDL